MNSIVLPTDRTVQCRAEMGMGTAATQGAIWTFVFSVLGKLVTVGGQLTIAWLLAPNELGLVALTLSVMSFTAVVGGANLKTILIQKDEGPEQTVNHLFWLALFLNLGAGVLLAAFSPAVGRVFHQPGIVPLLLVGALAIPIQSLSTVYLAVLHRGLHFEKVALIQFGAVVIQNGLAVWLAYIGCGPISLILPVVLTAIFMAVATRRLSGRVVVGKPQLSGVRELKRPAAWLIANGLCVAFLNSGANLVIGLVDQDAASAGYYFWGASLSCQAVFLLVTNLQGVLFPVLSRLNTDPIRQAVGAVRACRVLLVLVASYCVAQALIARPLIELAFDRRWWPATPVVQLLSLGMIGQPFYVIAVAILLARGQYRRLAALNGGSAFLLLLASAWGTLQGDHVAVAHAVATAQFVSNLVAGWLVLRSAGVPWRELTSTTIPPLVCAGGAGLAGWIVSGALTPAGPILSSLVVVAVTLGLTAFGVRLLMPATLTEILDRIPSFRLSGRTAEVAP